MGTENQNAVIRLTDAQVVEMLLKPIFTGTNGLAQDFTVMTNVTGEEKKIYTFGWVEELIQDGEGCGWNANGDFTLTPRTIVAKKQKVNVELCSDDFDGTVLTVLQGDGNNVYDLSDANGKQILNAAVKYLGQVVVRDYRNLTYFANYSKSGVAVPNFYKTKWKGLFQKIEEGVADGTVTKIGTDYSGAALSAGDSVEIFKALIAAQGLEMKGVSKAQKVIKCTESITDNYKEYLEAFGTSESYMVTVNGVDMYKYDGYMIEPMPEWDNVLQNKYGLSDPHRAILTVRKNFTLATDMRIGQADPEDRPEFVMEYKQMDELWKIKSRFRMGVNYAFDEFIVYAK